MALFAGAGVATYADPSDGEPVEPVAAPGPVKLTGWQLQNMQRQLNSGRGYLGRDLDALTADTGAGAQPVPISVVLAAWLQAADTPGADAGRELMGERDWAHDALDLTYPDAVLTLFTADLTAETAAGSSDLPGESASPAAYVQPPAAGTCSTVSSFIQDSFQNVVNILKFEADGGVTGVLATIWNTIIDIAATAAQIALGAVTSTLMAPIKQVAGVISLLSAASSLLVPWQAPIVVTPPGNLQPGVEGEATATIDPGPVSWPADLTDCAQVLLGIGLPELGDASGSDATWTVDDQAGTVSYGSTSTTVDSGQKAKLPFSTVPEDPALATGPELLHYVAFGVKVERAQVDQLVDLIDGLLVSGLPEPVLTVVKTLLGPLESETRARLAHLASVEGPVTSIFTVRHLPPEPTPPPGTEPTPDTCAVGPAGTIPDGTWSGPIVMQVVGTGAGDSGPGDVHGQGRDEADGDGRQGARPVEGHVAKPRHDRPGRREGEARHQRQGVGDGERTGHPAQPEGQLEHQRHRGGDRRRHLHEHADLLLRPRARVPQGRPHVVRRRHGDLRPVLQHRGQPGRGVVQGARRPGRAPRSASRGRSADRELEDRLEAVLVVPLLADLHERQLRDQAERGGVVGRDGDPEDADRRVRPGPVDHEQQGRPGVAEAPERRVDAVADLDHAVGVRRGVEARPAHDRTGVVVHEHAGHPGQVLRGLDHLAGPAPPHADPLVGDGVGRQGQAGQGRAPCRGRPAASAASASGERWTIRTCGVVATTRPASRAGSRRPPSPSPSGAVCAAWSAAGHRRRCPGCGRSRAGGSGPACRCR